MHLTSIFFFKYKFSNPLAFQIFEMYY